MSQNVYYVTYPRSSQAYNDARTPTWLNQIRYYNIFLNFVSQNVYYVAYPRSAQAYSDARTPTWLNQKDIPYLFKFFCPKMFIMLHIPEALRHTVMPGLQPGWNRKIYNICLTFCLKMVIMLYIPKALRDTVKPGLQPWCTRKDIQIRVVYSITRFLVYSLYFLT